MENKVTKDIFNPINENIKKLESLFPGVVKDGQVDFEALKQELGQFEEVGKEKYELTWPGKTKAKQLANTDIVGRTLKYVPEDSKNPETTENLYIEGDNLEVLKLLRNSYYGKIKMIYIDPPYNTGNDFIYKDDYSVSSKENELNEGNIDEEGNRLVKNQAGSGRFHSNWLNMMYPRLKIAKDLLTDDGVIFISIDDNEIENLKKICNEIFGEDNFIGQVTVVSNPRGRDYGGVARMHDYLLVYRKSHESKINLIKDENNSFSMFDELGGFELRELRNRNIKFNIDNRPNLYYPFYINENAVDENGLYEISLEPKEGWYELYPLESQGVKTVWRWGKSKSLANLNVNIKARAMRNGSYQIVEKYRESRVMARSVWWDKETNTEKGTLLLKELLQGKYFDYPKPVKMIQRMIEMGTDFDTDDIILDFFSGSATTAHAVMQLNAEDGGNRKFIMVQLPELCDEKSEAYKASYKNICEIGKERIRRAGEKIKEQFKDKEGIENLDIGFKVFRVADTNIRWKDNSVDEIEDLYARGLSKDALDFNPGFTDIDVVYEIMLRHRGFPLTSKINKLSNIGNRTYIFADAVVVCLEEKITNEIIDGIAAIEPKPIKVIFRDSAFDDDISLKLNTMNRLDAQLKKHNQGKEQSYRVEFI